MLSKRKVGETNENKKLEDPCKIIYVVNIYLIANIFTVINKMLFFIIKFTQFKNCC